MPFNELPQSVLFLIFLTFFVVAGIYPAWKKLAVIIRKALKAGEGKAGPGASSHQSSQENSPSRSRLSYELNEMEYLVISQLAQSGNKGMSRKQINVYLNLDPATLRKTLESLDRRGMIRLAMSTFFGLRIALSQKGHDYAVARGFIPKLLSSNGSPR